MIYYIVETEFGDPESRACKTLAEAKKEKKRIEAYYQKECGGTPYKLIIMEYEEET